MGYRGLNNGLNAELRARYNDSFPVMSGVYMGTQCIGGKEEDGAEPCVDSYTLFDLTLGYRLPIQGVSLQVAVQNLLDEDYRSFPGAPTIGRMALVSCATTSETDSGQTKAVRWQPRTFHSRRFAAVGPGAINRPWSETIVAVGKPDTSGLRYPAEPAAWRNPPPLTHSRRQSQQLPRVVEALLALRVSA